MSHVDPNRILQEIYLNGHLIANELLGLTITLEVNRIPKARIDLNYSSLDQNEGEEPILKQGTLLGAKEKKYKADFLPGNEVKIVLGRGKNTETIFIGYITKQHIEVDPTGTIILGVECRHKANRMTLQKRTRFFHHDANSQGSQMDEIGVVDDLEVLENLVKDNKDYELDLESDDTIENISRHENMTQYDCTDWDFLIIRAEALGYVCVVEDKTIKLLRLRINEDEPKLIQLGKDIHSFEAECDETISSKKNVFVSWDQENQEQAETNLRNGQVDQESEHIQAPKYVINPADIQEKEMDFFISGNVKRQQIGRLTGVVKIDGRIDIKLTKTIRIKGFHSIWDHDAFVSGVRHHLVGGTWFTYLQFGMSHAPHAVRYGIQNNYSDFIPKTNGLIYGNVVQYKTSDSGQELIEVEINGYNELNDNGQGIKRSIYARLATFAAGANGGAVFRPYPKDEVVIGFVNNDPRFPVILGAVYNGKNKARFELEDHENQPEVGFSINDWSFHINEKDEFLTISSPNGQNFRLDDKDKFIAMAYDSNNGIKIDQDGIELSGCKITLKGSNGIELEGNTIEAKADTTLKLEGGIQLELEGKVTASLKGQITQIN